MRLQLGKEHQMITRYADSRITRYWDERQKFKSWQETELAVIHAREQMGTIPAGSCDRIRELLTANDIDTGFINEREKVLNHDLNAFLEERMRFLPHDLSAYFHMGMTSYDTEEPVFVNTLYLSVIAVMSDTRRLMDRLRDMAITYRYTPMNARTHGQEAEMQSFGKRCLTWNVDLAAALNALERSEGNLKYSKLSGAIGSYSGIDPKLEELALSHLELKPWYGSTQIMPRVLYSPVAGALADIAMVMDKIATDIRLGSRSGRPLWHEPFGRSQKGSSAMPHKKNNITGENTEGMAIMARQYAGALCEVIKTWEERDISQSSVERVFWPDLFHVTLRAIKNVQKIMDGLVVYPDNMMIEIIESRGTYASSRAKEILLEFGSEFGMKREEAYRIVQLACFNVFGPSEDAASIREMSFSTRESSDLALQTLRAKMAKMIGAVTIDSIQDIILSGRLRPSEQLDVDAHTVANWNTVLLLMFLDVDKRKKWDQIFQPAHILANENILFSKIYGV